MTALAYIIAQGRGEGDRVLAEAAQALTGRGVILAGVVQHNTERASSSHCDMDLQVLGHEAMVRISQSLGEGSSGCRLDPEGLATAVGLVEQVLPKAAMLLINKFGKAEIEGGGFRTLIGEALSEGKPVLLGVKPINLPAFLAYAEGMAVELPSDVAAIVTWAQGEF